MSGIQRMHTVRVGEQDSNVDFSATPGVLRFLECEEADVYGRDTERLERNLYRGDGQEYAPLRGKKSLDPIGMRLPLRGVNGNTGTAAFVSRTATEAGILFDSIIAAAVDPSGVGNTATAGAGDTTGLTMTSGVNYANGGFVLLPTSTGTWAREIASGGGTANLVLDRKVTGVLTNPTTILRGAGWLLGSSTSMHRHLYIDGEGEWGRRTNFGCMSNLEMDFAEGEKVGLSMSWMPTDWSGPAKASPSFSAPSAGEYIVNLGASFWIADAPFILKNAKLTLGYTIQPRVTVNGPNGVSGYIVTRKQPVLSGTFYVGDNASFGELKDITTAPTLQSFQGLDVDAGEVPTTRDIAMQIGNQGTGALYLRIPAAAMSGRYAADNGVDVFNFEARATRPSSGSALRLAVF